jgi:hypothetical protein
MPRCVPPRRRRRARSLGFSAFLVGSAFALRIENMIRAASPPRFAAALALALALAALPGCGGRLEAGPSDGGAPDVAAEVGVSTCPTPLFSGGVTTPESLPLASMCAAGDRVSEGTCGGSLWVVSGTGVDCASFWVFDPTSRQLVATAQGCNSVRCTSAVPGFRFPEGCIDGDLPMQNLGSLCGETGIVDAGGLPPADAGGACVTIDPSSYATSCATASDCTIIAVGTLCDGSCACGATPVSASERARYQAATASIAFAACPCFAPPSPVCVAGTCVVPGP